MNTGKAGDLRVEGRKVGGCQGVNVGMAHRAQGDGYLLAATFQEIVETRAGQADVERQLRLAAAKEQVVGRV